MMIDEIKMIKAKFETISIVAGEHLELQDLSSPKYLKALIDATESTYVQLNDSLCESLTMCYECAQKRDLLNSYLHLFDDLELGKIVEDAEMRVNAFPKAVKEIIERINSVLDELNQ